MTNELSDPPEMGTGLDAVYSPLAKTENGILTIDQKNGGACAGDSGGPAYIESTQGLVLVGATRGPTLDSENCRHFGEFTSVSAHKQFILEYAKLLNAEAPQFIDLPF
ncbi:hypothetical protein [Bdellovibrio reynosensis]|uniref:Peptidase S1 domain-containing protein n=1 Tax=Bdellovibrio reynosensis TaxID=2835041 RepID=A0ABY4C4V3_9BACT|nr:hypothetical protein [Bdellovibrio reynosensis]UOE99989.1 hypothetical protein MNR06_09785 [Bdellovibrio reynosensis]